ncbi:hypothetical protein M5D96_000864 [Drosophila gunungcola]|uniref:Uncharacterized protein n=1 Tax=Drosophila gunungcola TaxID=103775 RepID=A0A9P9YXN5_9MUSC|nr:hypothetical protein M5D96_000864 [Drosophila gunungcola]
MACARKLLFRVFPNNSLSVHRTITMSAARRAEEAIEKLKESNPYYSKYAAKIAQLQQTSAEEFLDRVERVAELPHKKLTDIMKLELIADKGAEEISQIWLEYHKSKEVLAATLTTAQYETLMARAKEHPVFIIPLPRSEGFEFVMLQFAANTVHHENAPECLTMVHYTEVQDKGVVLMRGEYDNKVLTAQEAQCLANELQMFYLKPDEGKLRLLETFTRKPDEFKHMDLIKEVHVFATLTLGLLQMLTIHETMGMGIIGPASVCDLHMNQAQLASLTAAGFMGIICSSYFWGYITDKKGRRWTLLRTITLSNFVAGPSFVAATYLSEFCSHRILIRTITHMYMFTGFAMVYCPGWASLFLSASFMEFEVDVVGSLTLRPWRVLGCLNIIPGRGLATMEWISRKNTGRPLSDEQKEHLRTYQDHVEVKRRKGKHNFLLSMLNDAMPLFRKPFVGYFVCACLVMFVLGLLANGLGIWYTAMRNRCNMRQGNTEGMTFCRILFVPDMGPIVESESDLEAVCNDSFLGFNDSFILGAVYIVLYNLSWLSLFCVHKKVIFVFSLVAASTGGFLLIFVTNYTFQLFSLVFLIAFPGVTVGLLGGSLLGFVPTYIRGKALCISLMWCRCGAAIGAILVGSNIQDSCELILLAIAILPLS